MTPAVIIAFCGICPVANTKAFGGVATGSIKAQDALTAINAAKITGSNPNAGATAAKTGISSAALAVLLASSVKNTTKATMTRMTIKGDTPPSQLLRFWAKNKLVRSEERRVGKECRSRWGT